jgi:hypothetical protein
MDIKRLMSQAGGPFYFHFSNTMDGYIEDYPFA